MIKRVQNNLQSAISQITKLSKRFSELDLHDKDLNIYDIQKDKFDFLFNKEFSNFSEEERKIIIKYIAEQLNIRVFNVLNKYKSFDRLNHYSDDFESHFYSAYYFCPKVNLKNLTAISEDKFYEAIYVLNNSIYFIDKQCKDLVENVFDENNIGEVGEVDMVNEFIKFKNNIEEDNLSFLQKYYDKIEKEGKLINVLNSVDEIRADIYKLADKYTIRLSDGKYYVASGDTKIAFKDPSDNPGWAMWFLQTVPLDKIIDPSTLLLLSEEERQKIYPQELMENPIICHASLWDLNPQSGILLHTGWNHIKATYQWIIDKPIEVASMMFRAVNHPAQIARNFNMLPNLAVPGKHWFR